MGEPIVGQTRNTGFQIGVRQTLPIAYEAAWQLVTSQSGVKVWLGVEGELHKGAVFRLADGITGKVTVFSPNSHLRMTWHPVGWNRPSIIQLRVLANGSDRTTIAFHQEWLPGPYEREERRAWFAHALNQLKQLV